MSNVTVKAKDAVSHGAYRLARGQEAEMPASIAKDLEKAGLVTIRGDADADAEADEADRNRKANSQAGGGDGMTSEPNRARAGTSEQNRDANQDATDRTTTVPDAKMADKAGDTTDADAKSTANTITSKALPGAANNKAVPGAANTKK